MRREGMLIWLFLAAATFYETEADGWTAGPIPPTTTDGPIWNVTERPDGSDGSGLVACKVDSIGDGECDYVNNNEECQWDGGDCCKDSWRGKHCRRVKRKGSCNKGDLSRGQGPIANCQKTCKHC